MLRSSLDLAAPVGIRRGPTLRPGEPGRPGAFPSLYPLSPPPRYWPRCAPRTLGDWCMSTSSRRTLCCATGVPCGTSARPARSVRSATGQARQLRLRRARPRSRRADQRRDGSLRAGRHALRGAHRRRSIRSGARDRPADVPGCAALPARRSRGALPDPDPAGRPDLDGALRTCGDILEESGHAAWPGWAWDGRGGPVVLES